jgi:hypothetical protein
VYIDGLCVSDTKDRGSREVILSSLCPQVIKQNSSALNTSNFLAETVIPPKLTFQLIFCRAV